MPNPSKVRVKVQKRSGFDKSHFNLLTAQVGSLVPIMVDEVIGNTRVNLRVNLQATMPPLVSDTFMKTDVCVEAFFCPHRLLYGGFESWYTQRDDKVVGQLGTLQDTKVFFPAFVLDTNNEQFPYSKFGAGSLSDYLGLKDLIPQTDVDMALNPMPYLCYHLIWQEYYRAPLIEKPCFARPSARLLSTGGQVARDFSVMSLPYISLDEVNFQTNRIVVAYAGLADDTSMWDLRQRNFGLDYFTNAFPTPSLGGDQQVQIADSKFTISALRAANSLQQFQEKNQIAGTRYSDTVLARTGKSPSDGVVQRPVLLGAAKYNAYNKGIDTYAGEQGYSEQYNPFTPNGGVATFGKMVVSGSDLLIDGFECNEPGYIMVIASLVPTVTYSSGTSRILTRYRSTYGSIADMANPMLQNVGNEPIYRYELTGGIGYTDDEVSIFGYTDRFASWCTKNDEIHGLFRSGYNLDSFVSQRYFGRTEQVAINSNFLKIPTDYLDNVTMMGTRTSRYGYWMQIGFDYKVSQPLAEYSIPSLQDPAYEHGQTITLHRGGFRF